MSHLIVLKDASASSLISYLALALRMIEKGDQVRVLLTEEALAAAAGGIWDWPDLLRERDTRLTIAHNAGEMGLPVLSKIDKRQIDVKEMIRASSGRGVIFIACPIWTKLLGLEGRIPSWLGQMDYDDLVEEARRRDSMWGTF